MSVAQDFCPIKGQVNYISYPEVRDGLLSSSMKREDNKKQQQ